MKKIAFIGAGSFGFTRKLVKDILTFEAFKDAEIALMDIDKERLGYIEKAVKKINEKGGYNATVTATTDRKEALKNADGVLITILQGGVKIWRNDIEIPEKYNVDINVGDTRGPSGIFRALRTIPIMLDIAKDINELCPKAVVLNYTNPMAMLCRAVQEVYPNLCFTGLCHSVQSTASKLAEWIGADENDVTYLCAGINHQAWYLKYEVNGKNSYPQIRKKIEENEEILNSEQVRNDMFLHLDYYVTESSGHNSEYTAWYRKRPDLIKRYCTDGTGWNPGKHAFILNEYIQREADWTDNVIEWIEKDDIDLERGNEYASYIFNAVFGDGQYFQFNGNVRNNGLIENLPEGCCVEVPVLASKRGLDPLKVGKLPDHLAVINGVSAGSEELAVKGALKGDKRMIYHAVLMDPLTSAVLSPAETEKMVKEMFEANKDYLTYFD